MSVDAAVRPSRRQLQRRLLQRHQLQRRRHRWRRRQVACRDAVGGGGATYAAGRWNRLCDMDLSRTRLDFARVLICVTGLKFSFLQVKSNFM